MKRANTLTPAKNAEPGAIPPSRVGGVYADPLVMPVKVSFVVRGQVYSMKNSKTLTWRGGTLRTIKHSKAQQFERDFAVQVPAEYRRLGMAGPLRVVVTVYYPDRRQDLDCALVFDLLQKTGVIKNDRDLIEQHLYREVDAKNPRCEITVEAI